MRSNPTAPRCPVRRRCACFGVGGFTLLEMIGVFAVIMIIAGIVLGIVPGALRHAHVDQAAAELQIIQQGLEAYRARFGDYPRPPRVYEDQQGNSLYGVTDSAEYLANALNGRFGPAHATDSAPSMLNNSALTYEKPDLPLSNVTRNRILDPWGQPYRYAYAAPEAATSETPFGYRLYSLGPDQAEGGAADADNVCAQ